MKVALVGHDNYGSREIFTQVVSENPNVEFVLFLTHGLYYRKSFMQSVIKLLREASFIFCVLRFLEGILYKLKGDTLERRARKFGVKIYSIDDINSDETLNIVSGNEIDLIASMFTMQIYKKRIINAPRLGTIGTHPSILPEYRGLEVFFWQLANEEIESGVSVFCMHQKIDFGEVFLQVPFSIDSDESVVSIYEKLTELTAEQMSKAISKICSNDGLDGFNFIKSNRESSYYPMPTRSAFKKFLKTKHSYAKTEEIIKMLRI